ncbi:uncharacterized protein JCM15063_005865 [Sporobolomyces koalae]|uniref:uncharacterized protein n=1 Tax=Sporobolomyces koalae TaxID=500713 RepID=UPI00317BF94C
MLLMGTPDFVQCPDEQLPSIKHLVLFNTKSFWNLFGKKFFSRLGSISSGSYEANALTYIQRKFGFTQVLESETPFEDADEKTLDNVPMISVLRLGDRPGVKPASKEQIMAMNSLLHLDYYIRSASLALRLEVIILPASYTAVKLPKYTKKLVSNVVDTCRFRGIKVIFEEDRTMERWHWSSPAMIRFVETKAEAARQGSRVEWEA